MKVLGDLFGSAAKTELLRVLYYQPGGMALRSLARTAGMGVHSAELALKFMVKDKLVRRSRAANRVIFALQMDDPRYAVLAGVFDAAALAVIRAESQSLDGRARCILSFIRQATGMLKHAREVGVVHDT